MTADPKPARSAVFVSFLLTIVAFLAVAIPLCVIRPFVPQSPAALAFALHVRNAAPILAHLCLLVVALTLFFAWRAAGRLTRATLILCTVLTAACAFASPINIFEKMFHPYRNPAFGSAAEAPIDAEDKLLSVTIAGETHAFPIRTMGYHHIVNDMLGGVPIAATYCTLCHTGIVYDRRLNGQTLTFFLAGINNGNALLRDRETGTIWQQSTGEGIFGPLKGQHLTLIPSDELTFALWRNERPHGLILRPDPTNAALYDPADWEAHIARTHVVVPTPAAGPDPHTIMLGLEIQGETKAFPIGSILSAHVIEDHLAGQPILLMTGPDNASIRAFTPRAGDRTLTFVSNPNGLEDRETSSLWNFAGCATSGLLSGQCLPPLEAHKTYWFDWLNHHPETHLFHG